MLQWLTANTQPVSGTEPKVRFYVEARDPKGCAQLVDAAKSLLAETGLLP